MTARKPRTSPTDIPPAPDNPPARKKTTPTQKQAQAARGINDVDLAKRRALLIDMIQQGWSFRRAAEALNVSIATAHNDWTAAIAEAFPQEKKEAAVALQKARLEDMWRKLYPRLENGKDDWAYRSAFGIIDRLTKLQGLNAPTETKVEVVTPDDIGRELEAFLAGLQHRTESETPT
jgi:hypothetical protein